MSLPVLAARNIYKSYLPKGELKISACGTGIVKNNNISAHEASQALSNVSIKLFKGEIISVLGANGSGKSTLLKTLSGLSEPDSGSVTYNGVPVYGPVKKLVAGHPNIKLIHQNYNLFPNISLAENIKHVIRFLPAKVQEKKLQHLLQVCGLKKVKDKLPKEVSGGEQQRTAIAAALAAEADVLLLDEPFANLDTFTKFEIKHYIQEINKNFHTTVLLVTHDPTDALAIAQKVYILKKGKILEHGTPEQVYQYPKHAYTAQITGGCSLLSSTEMLEIKNYTGHNLHEGSHYLVRPEQISILKNPEGKWQLVQLWFTGKTYLCKLINHNISIWAYSPIKLTLYNSYDLEWISGAPHKIV